MKKPDIPKNENERLENLESYQLIGLKEQEEFDFLTSMASGICETKISLISLITDDKQWFLSHHGLEVRETPKDYAFCAHAINSPDDPFVVENAKEDERFYDNPLTTGDPHVIFYAGIPLVSSAGFPLGTLCAIDDQPKKLSEKQIEELKKLAKLATALFEKRKNEIENSQLINELDKKNQLFEETQKINKLGIWELDIATGITVWNDLVYEIHEVPKGFDHNKVNGIEFYHKDYQKVILDAVGNCITQAIPFDLECVLITAKKNQKWVRATGRKVGDKLIGSFQDITELKSKAYKQELVIKGANVGTWEWNVQTGETIIDEKWAEIIGYKPEELSPFNMESWENLLHPDDLKETPRKLDLCFEKKLESYDSQVRMKHKDGHWVWVYDRGKVMEWTEDGKPLLMYGMHQEITQRKKVEEELNRTSILLKSAQHLAKMGAWELDLATGKTFWTDEVYHIHEVTKDFDHNKANEIEFYHPDYRPIITKAFTDSIEKQIPFDVKCKFITAKNNLRWVRSSGYPLFEEGKVSYLIGMFRDITEEEEAKEAIIREQFFSKQLLENMADGFLVVDTAGKLIGVNRALCQITGFSEDELIGKTAPYPFWPTKELPTIDKAFQQAITGEKNTFELYLQKKNGNLFPAIVSSGILFNDKGQPISYFANIKDISERKKAELALLKQKNYSESLLNSIPDLVFVLDKNGTFLEYKSGNEKDLIEPSAKFLGKTLNELFPPILAIPMMEKINSVLSKQIKESLEYQIPKDGTLIDFEARYSPFGDNNVIALVQNISERKKAELELFKQKQYSESLLNAIPDLVFVLDKNGTFLDYKSGTEKQLAVPPAMFLGKTLYDIFPPEFANQMQEKIDSVSSNQTIESFEYQIPMEGTLKNYEARFSPFGDNSVVVLVQNINERKKAEAELTNAKNFLQQTGQVAKVGGWDFNILTGEITWSDTICDILEVPHGFVPTYEQMANFFTPESWTQLQEAIEKALTEGASYDLELQIITAKGKEIWVKAIGNSEFKDGKCIRLFGVLQDISIQKEAELMIVESKEKYQSLVQNIPGITYRCKNDKDWTMLYLSSQVDSITGYTAEELMGNSKVSYGMLILAEDNEMVTQAVNDGIAANMHWEVEYRIRHKDGSIRFAFEKGTVIKNEKNEVLYLDGFILDITDRKKAENEIKSLLKITEEQNSRLKNFAHIVSHNLRSHSSGISGLLELIEIERPEIFNFEMMLLLKMGAENLKQTIEDLTEVVRVNLDVDELYEINLNSIIENNINSLSSLINNAGIKIINEISHEVKVKGIMAYMNSIALNMITNAIKYKSEERQSFLRIFCKEDESFITLYFQDNGLGIDLKKYGDKLFGMYKTFHRHHDARGVGLFITKNQVESMGGKIMVESEVNIGTTFKIIFKK